MRKFSKVFALVMVLSLALTSIGFAEMDKGELYFPELPNNTLSITVNAPNFGTDQTTTKMQEIWQQKMEEYLGIKLDITWTLTPWNDFRNNESVLLASGDIADVNTYSQGTLVNEYGADGLVLDINKYKDYFVYYPDFLAGAIGGPEGVNNEDGSSYVFWDGYENDLNLAGAQSFTSFAYRFDLLKANNLAPATTWAEFKTLCADIQGLIDSGAVDAKYVITNTGTSFAFYRGFVGIFHTWDTTYWNGENWAYGPIEDNFRAMLIELNELYDAGYIDPEFATLESADPKTTTGQVAIIPTLWAGSPFYWNTAAEEGIEWGNAFLPTNPDYGTPWKWGSKLEGKNLGTTRTMGIIISADTEYPEWIVRMIDYQYSEDMYYTLNWGIEGETFEFTEDGGRKYVDSILNADNPGQELGTYGVMASGVARTGIAFVPQIFSTILSYSATEPWWSAEKGYFDGQYWIESAVQGGPDSVSPYDRAPIVNLTEEESTSRATMASACGNYARTEATKFITGELDVNDDAAWESYVSGVKSQFYGFDEMFETLNAKSDLASLEYYK